MKENNHILDTVSKVRPEVPEGYFEDLRVRLSSIPETEGRNLKTRLRYGYRPYLSIAAALAALIVAGAAILLDTDWIGRSKDSSLLSEDYLTADLYYMGNLEYYQELEDYEELSGDDIVDYLIESGEKTDRISQYLYENSNITANENHF